MPERKEKRAISKDLILPDPFDPISHPLRKEAFWGEFRMFPRWRGIGLVETICQDAWMGFEQGQNVEYSKKS